MHESHGTHLVVRRRHRQALWLFMSNSFARLDMEIELWLLVDSIHTLVIPFQAIDVTQLQLAKIKTPASTVIRQSDQPIGHFIIVSAAFALLAIAKFSDAKRHSSDSYADALFHDSFLG